MSMKWLVWCCLWLYPVTCALAEEGDTTSLVLPTDTDYPVVIKSGKKLADFVPPKWTIMSKASGSLKDKDSEDIALVLKANKRKYVQKNSGLGAEKVVDTNPLMLVVLFKDPATQQYTLAEQSNHIIPIRTSPTMAEPFKGLSIRDGILKIDFTFWYSAGTWLTSDTSYKFRWQKNKFVLIGADKTEIHRGLGTEVNYSYNFLTGQEKITSGTGIQGEARSKRKVRWENLNVKSLKPMATFKDVGEWEVAPDESL